MHFTVFTISLYIYHHMTIYSTTHIHYTYTYYTCTYTVQYYYTINSTTVCDGDVWVWRLSYEVPRTLKWVTGLLLWDEKLGNCKKDWGNTSTNDTNTHTQACKSLYSSVHVLKHSIKFSLAIGYSRLHFLFVTSLLQISCELRLSLCNSNIYIYIQQNSLFSTRTEPLSCTSSLLTFLHWGDKHYPSWASSCGDAWLLAFLKYSFLHSYNATELHKWTNFLHCINRFAKR